MLGVSFQFNASILKLHQNPTVVGIVHPQKRVGILDSEQGVTRVTWSVPPGHSGTSSFGTSMMVALHFQSLPYHIRQEIGSSQPIYWARPAKLRDLPSSATCQPSGFNQDEPNLKLAWVLQDLHCMTSTRWQRGDQHQHPKGHNRFGTFWTVQVCPCAIGRVWSDMYSVHFRLERGD